MFDFHIQVIMGEGGWMDLKKIGWVGFGLGKAAHPLPLGVIK